MKYLVTGGAGFIGSHLVDKLIDQGHEVLVIDNLSTGKKENINPKVKFHQVDICDLKKIMPLFNGVDGVFHLAAIPRVPLSIKDPVNTTKVNILGTVNVFKAAVEGKVKRIVFASSSAIYGEQKKMPFKEGMNPNPLSPYALQKLTGEYVGKIFSNLYGLPIVSLRYFNVYGPRIDFDSDYGLVLGKFLKLRAENKPLSIYGNGEQTRGFCFVGDVVNANIKAMKNNKLKGGEIINISHKESYSINYLAHLLGGKIQYFEKRPGDPMHTEADINLAKKLLGWEPKINFKEGLKITQNWFKKYVKK